MAKNDANELTPMMRQYMDIKKEHSDEVLFFRLGDFYEMFFEDAVEISHLLNLTLTHRAGHPMCGIPYHAAKTYLRRLLDLGKKVAICEQLSLSESSKELAKREVVQIYTPGTVIEDEYLDSETASFIVSVNRVKTGYAAAYADITTGEFCVRHIGRESLYSVLSSIMAREVVVDEDLYFTDKDFRRQIDELSLIVSKVPGRYFAQRDAVSLVTELFSVNSTEVFQLDAKDPCIAAAGALIRYIKDMCRTELRQFENLKVVRDEGYLILDASSERNLELTVNMHDGTASDTLYSVVNRTVTGAGARLLKDRLMHPVADAAEIGKRLDWVSFFYENIDERKRVRELLRGSSDLIRIAGKLDMKRSVPRTLIAISESVGCFFRLVSQEEKYLSLVSEELHNADALIDLVEEINRAVNPECTNLYHEGEVINTGYDAELDSLRETENGSSALLSDYLEKVKGESGLTILKLGENRIIGYYLEVPKGQLDRVPSYFIRRQTLVGGERFTTPELTELENRIRSAGSMSAAKEKEIYNAITARAASLSQELRLCGTILSKLDLYQSSAECASQSGHVRPVITQEGSALIIEGGRHPVVEAKLPGGTFVRNSFSSEKSRFALITGPNMAGKSTFLRQTALIVLMAHAGLFVPADRAEIPVTDRIFTRVGAYDNLAKGESTFMVEMRESANIIRNAGKNSLVIMDETGRGTSTQDGMSIAYAIMQFLLKLGSVTLFATHYHELTMLDTSQMQLLTLEVVQDRSNITFVRKVIEGVAESSYGLHVARLAGVPQSVIRSASAFQKQHFASYSAFDEADQLDLFTDTSALGNDAEHEIIDSVMDFDIQSSTPMEALMFLDRLQNEIRKKGKQGT
ncbi:MAG: DNA mismatch repair protein MutS [Bullifex sp.]|nr:DNA mismatch repair protein MutS [Bullifex sp.]MDY5908753.1 DNA mismatch repair protein MutS [Bullifex sp.]